MKPLTPNTITPAQIEEWKTKYPTGVFGITVRPSKAVEAEKELNQFHLQNPNGTKDQKTLALINDLEEKKAELIIGYFRKPTIAEIGIGSQTGSGNAFKMTSIIYDTCLLGGNPDFGTNDDVKMSAMTQFGELLKPLQASIKKL